MQIANNWIKGKEENRKRIGVILLMCDGHRNNPLYLFAFYPIVLSSFPLSLFFDILEA